MKNVKFGILAGLTGAAMAVLAALQQYEIKRLKRVIKLREDMLDYTEEDRKRKTAILREIDFRRQCWVSRLDSRALIELLDRLHAQGSLVYLEQDEALEILGPDAIHKP